MINRVLVICLFVAVGLLFGILAAQYAKEEFRASPVLCIITVFFFLAIFTGISQLVLLRLKTPEVTASIISPLQSDTWGWLIPRKDPTKAGYPLNKDRMTIGRDVKNDILLNDPSVSRVHVEVIKNIDGYLIKDQGSKNGLFVNNQRVEEHQLQEGDSITIGDIDFFYRSSKIEQKNELE